MGLSVPLNALATRLQYKSTVTLILTESEAQTERDTKTVESYINMLPCAGPHTKTSSKYKCYITFFPFVVINATE